jgi:hypothetical protein
VQRRIKEKHLFSKKLARFQELAEERRVIRVRPKFPPDETLHGIPLAASETLVLLQEVHEFHLDGYTVIPLKNVAALRAGAAEETIQRILVGEGVFSNAGINYDVQIDSFQDLFRSLKKAGKNVIVELLPEGPRDDMDHAFLIGRVVGMSARSVAIMHFDAVGKWSSESTVLPYDMIKWVTFDTEYVNVFSKYLQ